MRVVLTNRRARFTVTPIVQSRLKRFFRYHTETYEHSDRFRKGLWDGYKHLLKWSAVGTGLFLRRKDIVEHHLKRKFQVEDQRTFPVFNNKRAPGLWAHQYQCVDAMIAASNTGGLILMATGTGKTRAAAAYFLRLEGHGLFIVDELVLLHQTKKAFEKVLGEPIGIVGESEFDPQRITVATIQTLWRNRKAKGFRKWFRQIDVVHIDEVHVAMNKSNIDILRTINPKAVFGLTASLQLMSREIRFRAMDLTGPPVFTYTIAEGQRDGVLTSGKIYRLHHKTSCPVTPPRKRKHTELINRNTERNQLIGQLVSWGLDHGRTTVVLAERREHLVVLDKQFRRIPHGMLSGLIPRKDRQRALKQLAKGNTRLIVASRVFFKGVDIPEVDLLIDATGAPGINTAIQKFGRGIRKSDGKDSLIYIDICDYGARNPFAKTAHGRLEAWRQLGLEVTDIRSIQELTKQFVGVPARQLAASTAN